MNDKRPTEIGKKITTMYLTLNQMVGRDKIERKRKRHRDEMEVMEEIGRERRKRPLSRLK